MVCAKAPGGAETCRGNRVKFPNKGHYRNSRNAWPIRALHVSVNPGEAPIGRIAGIVACADHLQTLGQAMLLRAEPPSFSTARIRAAGAGEERGNHHINRFHLHPSELTDCDLSMRSRTKRWHQRRFPLRENIGKRLQVDCRKHMHRECCTPSRIMVDVQPAWSRRRAL